MNLKAQVLKIEDVSATDRETMFLLMEAHYENMKRDTFLHDFASKDFCVTLRDEAGILRGFSTQKLLTVTMEGAPVRGVFSGDTIIHRDYWGSPALFTAFARHFFRYAEEVGGLYWFLICKGYKTYRILPTFWAEFYPRWDRETPAWERAVIDAYASRLYPQDYNPATGVVEYRAVKDRLKPGVADVRERQIKNRDTAWFVEANPGWRDGNDLCCLARLDRSLLKSRAGGLLFGGD